MPLVPAGVDHPTKMKALIEKFRSLAPGAFISFLFPNQNLDLLGQQTTD
jgi:hypothetical protein